MMKAIKINICGASFLLPDSHQFYEFPSYILKHKDEIREHVEAGKKLAQDPRTDHFSGLSDISEFKRITGIIGFPFDARDTNLYALDKSVDITMEVDL